MQGEQAGVSVFPLREFDLGEEVVAQAPGRPQALEGRSVTEPAVREPLVEAGTRLGAER